MLDITWQPSRFDEALMQQIVNEVKERGDAEVIALFGPTLRAWFEEYLISRTQGIASVMHQHPAVKPLKKGIKDVIILYGVSIYLVEGRIKTLADDSPESRRLSQTGYLFPKTDKLDCALSASEPFINTVALGFMQQAYLKIQPA